MTENTYEHNPVKEQTTSGELTLLVDKAFAKGLAAVILAEIPVGSLIAIFLGRKASKLVSEAEKIAEQTGLIPGGKKIAAKVLGKIGFIAGLAMSGFWALYTLFLMIYIPLMIFLTSY